MKTKLKRAKKYSLIFIGGMLVLTFFSQSILYFLLPKVEYSNPRSGAINNKTKIEGISKEYTQAVNVRIPYELKIPLYISEIPIYEGMHVERGMALIKFEKEECIRLLETLSNQINSVVSEQEYYKLQIQQVQKDYTKQIQEEQKKLEVIESDPNQLVELAEINLEISKQKQLLKEYKQDMEINKDLYKEGGISKKDLEMGKKKVAEANAQIQYLNNKYNSLLKDKKRGYIASIDKLKSELEVEQSRLNFEMKKQNQMGSLQEQYENIKGYLQGENIVAPISGTIEKIYLEVGSEYKGSQVVCKIIPDDSACIYTVDLEKEQKQFWTNKSEATLLCNGENINVILKELQEVDGKIKGIIELKNKKTEIRDLDSGILTIKNTSDSYSAIVARQAVIDNSVYVLKERKGFFGDEYYVEKKQVVVGKENENEIGIISGLTIEDRVIIYWDKELSDNQRVMLKLS